MLYVFSPGINTLAWNHNLWLHCEAFGEVDDWACPENSSKNTFDNANLPPPVKHLHTPAH